ncbi:DgyrCDS8623 [Dimorphilus gyrociliatus]|uniref:DgyrCDS8623 n=1 Tax=Dimorphilus gyrociliatus TaxID=2664684 RepID=A0A7I8VUY1_9ANNE|nr:DgyrCDS8623 [Dimorphilus gyrociliatus]
MRAFWLPIVLVTTVGGLFEFRKENWGRCKPIEETNCCSCEQKRLVSCVHSREPVPASFCRGFQIEKPSEKQKCKTCQNNCVVSEWSPWSGCSSNCLPIQYRSRSILLPPSEGLKCPDLVQTKKCANFSTCSTKSEWKTERWSSCRLWNTAKKSENCQKGIKKRLVQCIGREGNVIPEKYCRNLQKPIQERQCSLPCDCLVSEWQSWSSCSSSCGRGQKKRRRKTIRPSSHRGISCPPQIEIQPCVGRECSRGDWTVKDWGRCIVKGSCGSGYQNREVICRLNSDGQAATDNYCVASPKPITTRACLLPCNIGCEYGEWGSWSECHEGMSHRTREILTPEQDREHLGCDKDKPIDLISCKRWGLYWKDGPWSECSPEDNRLCGKGISSRTIHCFDVNSKEVEDDHKCELSGGTKPLSTKNCYKPCSNGLDCQVSEWTEWSDCSVTCGQGHKTRTKSVRERGKITGRCVSDEDLKETTNCPPKRCIEYLWNVSRWSNCKKIGADCGENKGIQERSVTCIDPSTKNVVDEDLCDVSLKPKPKKACTILCSSNCKMTMWNEWSPCSQTCGEGTRQRWRRIDILPVGNGKKCPGNLSGDGVQTVEEKCKVRSCKRIDWKEFEWKNCTVSNKFLCGYGKRKRKIICEEKNDGRNRTISESICAEKRPKPATEESCFIPCAGDCILTEWSAFGQCNHSCKTPNETSGYRVRYRQIKEFGDNLELEELCSRIHSVRLEERQPCNNQTCPMFKWKLGSWGSCIIKNETYGPGVLKRQVSCVKINDSIETFVSNKFCPKHMPQTRRSCSVKRPIDCKLSNWQPWSSCLEACGEGIQYRNRSIDLRPGLTGRPCRPLKEKRVCTQRDCHELEWKVGDWGSCESKESCGEGIQNRSVTCPAGSESLCLRLAPKPKTEEICDNACVGDCKLSHWSVWSPCDCMKYRRKRTRKIEKERRGEAKKCDRLTEEQECACRDYKWKLGEWTDCILNGSTCGVGQRLRPLNCVRLHDSMIVSHTYCEKKHLTNKETCRVECDRDCQLSPWSSWSSCSKTCGPKMIKVRTRRILQQPVNYGRPCPKESDLEQKSYCKIIPCYKFSWSTSDWSECSAGYGQCGQGTRHRTVYCERSDGRRIEEGCKLQKPKTEESCYIPCPGDCIITEWSEWGPCFLDCKTSKGISYKSRSVVRRATNGARCSEEGLKERECKQPSCPIFKWMTTERNNRKRAVYCVFENKGSKLRLDGGCDQDKKPSDSRFCKNCHEHAQCYDGNCVCKLSYSGNGTHCLLDSGCTNDRQCSHFNYSFCNLEDNRCRCSANKSLGITNWFFFPYFLFILQFSRGFH